MQTIEQVREECRYIGKNVEEMVREGKNLCEQFEGTQMIRLKIDKDGNSVKVVGGELGGDDSQVVISESGVTKVYGDEIVGYAFDPETRAALVEFFETLYCN